MDKRRHVPKLSAAAVLFGLLVLIAGGGLFAFDSQPPPEFETGYEYPEASSAPVRAAILEYLDVAVLILFLAATTLCALKFRSRMLISILTIGAVLYFGFFRKGCVCPVGSIQNITLALFNPAYFIPITVVLFFVIPLVTTLFFGRTFCASVCPLGAIQDLVVFRPQKVPEWIARPLRFLPVLYLGFAVLFAATGAEFIVCRFDPFISFFRFGGSIEMLMLGGCFLLIGLFIARPYCRFLCPYGLLLGWISKLSKWHTSITPDTCITCRLCENSCPFDAIQKPVDSASVPERPRDRKRLAYVLLALPIVVALSGGIGYLLHPSLARMHPSVRLADRLAQEDAGLISGTTLESDTFRASTGTRDDLAAEVGTVVRRFRTGSVLLGIFIGIIFMVSFVRQYLRRTRTEYRPDRETCLSCGRCFAYCPREHLRIREFGAKHKDSS